jgi:hypothetical protein
LFVAVLVFIIAAPLLHASTNEEQSKQHQQGTVLSVERQEVRSPEGYYSGTDVPLQSEYYAYNVSVRVGCVTYHGRYETPFDYLPSAFGPGKPIQVRMTKYAMHFDVPGDNEFMVRGKEKCLTADNSAEQV